MSNKEVSPMHHLYFLMAHATGAAGTTAFAFLSAPHSTNALVHFGFSVLAGLAWPIFWTWQILLSANS